VRFWDKQASKGTYHIGARAGTATDGPLDVMLASVSPAGGGRWGIGQDGKSKKQSIHLFYARSKDRFQCRKSARLGHSVPALSGERGLQLSPSSTALLLLGKATCALCVLVVA
jgi:hypothetical protein